MKLPQLLTLAVSFVGMALSQAAVTAPTWASEPSATYQWYLFNSDTLTPAPDPGTFSNAFGTPSATVNLGFLASGWQDPASPFDAAGVTPSDGAWGYGGTGGEISVTIPISDVVLAPGDFFVVDFVIASVALSGGGSEMPGLAIDQYTPQDLTENDTFLEDTGFMSDAWYRRVWTGSLEGVTGDSVTVRLTAPSGMTEHWIDDLEIYTRYTVVPEPSAAMLLLVGGAVAGMRRQRKRMGA